LVSILVVLVVTIILYNFIPRSQKNVSNKICLITGAGSGLGRLLSLKFAKLGAQLVLLDINEKGIESVGKEIAQLGGLSAHCYTCDVSNKDQVKQLAQTIKKEVGKVDILINNAGIVAGDYIWDLKDEQIEKIFKVNTMAVIWMVRAFLPDMIKENDGHLVTIASAAAASGVTKLSDYCASKAATWIFHESVRLELKKIQKNWSTHNCCLSILHQHRNV